MSRRHVPALDGYRGMAVLMVFAYHFVGGSRTALLPVRAVGLLSRAMWMGVDLFFVLSGFLITGNLWDSRGSEHWYRNFYGRRALRTFPLYYLALTLVLIAAAVAGTFSEALHRIWSPALFLTNIPGVPSRVLDDSGSPLPVRHFWSLAVEEQFYLL